MNGLELSRRYYNEILLPECKRRIPNVLGHFAAGLVGEGSECFGFDDELSQDHSFGPRLCLWLTQEEYEHYGKDLNTLWQELPDSFMGYKRPVNSINEGKRDGIFTVDEFYKRMLGIPGVPGNLKQWIAIGEPYFAAATNGVIYTDQSGEFTETRKKLLNYYPEDVIRYYLAQHAAIAAQTGQYNLLRAYRHGEELAVNNIKSRFIQSVIAMVFLLNKTYRPFYKWAPRAMRSLPIQGRETYDKLLNLSNTGDIKEQVFLVEDICANLLLEMRMQGYTFKNSNYLMDHLTDIMKGIESLELRNRGISLVF